MKKMVSFAVLLLTAFIGLSAQQALPEMGLAIVCVTDEEGLFATHPNHPFGSVLLITNMYNDTQLEVQVGGRPDRKSGALVEICELAASFLGMEKGVLTQVRVELVSKPAAGAPAMRARASVSQTGRALVQNTGDDLVIFHPSIPLTSRANLTNTANGKTVVVTVKGRVPASKDRIVEISRATAQALGIQGSGQVRLETINR